MAGAISDFTAAIQIEPNAQTYTNRGVVRASSGDLEGALTDHDEAIRLQPADAVLYYNRALTKEGQSAFASAIADYQKYIELGGDDPRQVEEKIRRLRAKDRE